MRLLDGEQLVIDTRPHGRVLVVPIVVLIVLAALTGAGLAMVPPNWRPVGQYVVAGLGLALLLAFVVRPVAAWARRRTILTTRRLIASSGIGRRTRNEVALNRIMDVGFVRRPGDLGFGSGTLLLTTVAGSRLRLDNMPQIRALAEAVSELATEAAPAVELAPPEGDERWY